MVFAHFIMTWAPGEPKITSPLNKCLVASNTEEEGGATFDNLRNPKYASMNTALYKMPSLNLLQALTRDCSISRVIFALTFGL